MHYYKYPIATFALYIHFALGYFFTFFFFISRPIITLAVQLHFLPINDRSFFVYIFCFVLSYRCTYFL